MASIRVTRAQLKKGIRLQADMVHQIVVVPSDLAFTEFENVLFNHDCSALLAHTGQKPSEDEAEPIEERLGISLIARSLQFLEQTQKRWLVVGHTDSTGSNQHNGPLSKHRASCIEAALLGERDAFAEAANGPHIPSQDERREIQRPTLRTILTWAHEEFAWPCRIEDNFGSDVEAIRDFQRSYNVEPQIRRNNPALEEDGDIGPLTWAAIFDCYEFELARHLLVAVDDLATFRADIRLSERRAIQQSALGCGEHCPIEGAGIDNFRSASNKRAEILFFDEGEVPTISHSDGICDEVQSKWYRDLATSSRFSLPIVAWQFAHQAVQLVDSRSLLIQAPGLLDGESALVTVTQIVNGKEVPVVDGETVTISGGQAIFAFPEDDNERIFKEMPDVVGPDATYIDFSYRARVTLRGFDFFSRRLPVMTETKTSFYSA